MITNVRGWISFFKKLSPQKVCIISTSTFNLQQSKRRMWEYIIWLPVLQTAKASISSRCIKPQADNKHLCNCNGLTNVNGLSPLSTMPSFNRFTRSEHANCDIALRFYIFLEHNALCIHIQIYNSASYI